MAFAPLIRLLRPQQWYKNLLVFLAIFFAGELFDVSALFHVVIGFFSLCLASSAGYVLNDILDIKADRMHAEKKDRPLASGKVSICTAAILFQCLLLIAIALAYWVKPVFAVFPAALFANTLLYSILFKNIALVDIHFMAFNYLIRAIAGGMLAGVSISPWLILFVFVLALFLAIGKRSAELKLLGRGAHNHKQVYKVYTKTFLNWMAIVLLATLFFSYILYTFLAHAQANMMLTIPIVSFLIFKYLYFISVDHEIARKTELFFKDKSLVAGLSLWAIACFIILYLS